MEITLTEKEIMTKVRKMPIGTKVRMVNCYEAESYPNKVWKTRSEPWEMCGEMVVLLEGKAGCFSVSCLEIVPD